MKGLKECLELIAGLKDLAILGKQVMKDGKVDMADLALLPALLAKQDELTKAFLGLGEVVEEVKDLSLDEGLQLAQALVSAAKAVKEA